MTTKEMIAVMQAYVDGKQIQSRDKRLAEDDWWDNDCPTWDWERCEYRIKPEEEKPVRMTNRVLTPQEFAEKMKSISMNDGTEMGHANMDDLMCEVLESLGYGEGVKTFKETGKWYA